MTVSPDVGSLAYNDAARRAFEGLLKGRRRALEVCIGHATACLAYAPRRKNSASVR